MTTTWSGESPTSSCALTWAPLSNSSLAIVTCLLSTASKRGVCWRLLRRLTSEWGRACNQDVWAIDRTWIVRSTEFLLWVFMDQDGTENLCKKILRELQSRQYPAILTEQTWLITDLSYCLRRNYYRGTQRVISSGRDSAISPAWVANHSARFGLSYSLMKLVVK